MSATAPLHRFSLLVLLLLAITAVLTASAASAHAAPTDSIAGQNSPLTARSADHGGDDTGGYLDGGSSGTPNERLHGTTFLASGDSDADGLGDGAEAYRFGTVPPNPDTDGDTLGDGAEVSLGTDPTAADSDGDRLSDGSEVDRGTDPTRPDTDGDGITDGAEAVTTETDPLAADSDGDVLQDADELTVGADPTDWTSPMTMPGLAGGFIVGSILSTGLLLQWRRIEAYLEGLPLVGVAIRELATLVGGKGVDLDRRAEGPSPSDAEVGPRAVTDDEVLPDDARIRQLLQQHDGRARQGTIVEATEWSKSKVSRVLSRMAEEGAVVKIVLGRENLVCLPGYEPAIAVSSLGE